MSNPYLGEIRLVSFNFAAKGWARCEGQLLSIAQNQALFSLLGTTYGGNGQTTFALPDLRGRVPMHMHSNYPQGMAAGSTVSTLTAAEMPAHTHAAMASPTVSHSADPAGRVLGSVEAGALNIYRPADGSAALHPSTLSNAGGSQPHTNMQPYLTMTFMIAMAGIFPSRD
ncbi:phage tail protein [Pseudoduganella aquatica]|uniref:Phage tail protein n=1 Tax=Pseudoduganella aquatica TaxID=2660641 RepID=A0A7X4HGH4_9BURK|nr:tail fiber protein [Pseudoduganella aquatica]MYN10519.1 phage tail protein [Pseudoduganella aquatica]